MLKKTAAILILGIFIFNWFGYRVYTSMLQYMAAASLEQRLNIEDYVDSELVSIKIATNLPYSINSPDYQRLEGEVTIEGKHYNFVKRRVFNDSIEFLCIPNLQKTKLADASDEFYKQVNDLQHPSENEKAGSNSNIAKSLLSEYYQQDNTTCFLNSYIKIMTAHAAYSPVVSSDPALTYPGEPPEA